MSKTTPRKELRSAAAIAKQTVDAYLEGAIESDVPNAIGDDLAAHTAIWDALVAELPAHQAKDVLDIQGEVDLMHAVRDALPSEATRKQFSALCEWAALNCRLNETCGYVIGVAVGRRLAGAR